MARHLGALGCFVATLLGESGTSGSEDDLATAASEVQQNTIQATSDSRDHALNEALRQSRDVWGEQAIASGGATFEKLKDYLRPLFYSTGHTNTTLGVHHILYAADGGDPPHFVALADGSRIAADRYDGDRFLEFQVGAPDPEPFGSALDRLDGPRLENGYYPILHTAYTDQHGVRYEQESFASWIAGLDTLVAFVKHTATGPQPAAMRIRFADPHPERLGFSGTPEQTDGQLAYAFAAGDKGDVYLLWSPGHDLPEDAVIDAGLYEAAKAACKDYWDRVLSNGAQFEVPEPLVMDCQRNLLIQNRMLRWRYSLGSVVYHGSFYQPESSDAMSTLAMYGFTGEARDGLGDLMDMTKGKGFYVNWERGERLSHGAHYYFLTRDAAFLEEHTDQYAALCEELKTQIEADPNGLLERQRHCGDIRDVAYCTFQQAVCWRGLRDMAQAWRLISRDDLYARYAPTAASLKAGLLDAIARSQQTLGDGSLFVPSMLLEGEQPPYDPITGTRLGSYWNLCMPYAFASGLWDVNGPDMDGIVKYLHNHGAILLGLMRFNYYPTPIGSYRTDGLPGYCSTGFDNVYLPSYQRLMADRDEADRLIVSLYGKLCHGQTRDTFISGEGDTATPRPNEPYRSSYGACSSANNTAFLLPLRLMLVRESFDPKIGLPRDLFLAHATPRHWLEQGRRVEVTNAPTCFGVVNYTLVSDIDNGTVAATVRVPARDPIRTLRLRFRLPAPLRMHAVTVNGATHDAFDPEAEMIDLTGCAGELAIEARVE